MKKVVLSLLFVATSLVAVDAPASAAVYDGETLEELYQDPTLHNQHSIVIRFYAAVFARTPDNDGIRFWLNQYDTGEWSTRRIANFFVTSDEFVALYGEDTTNEQFVDAVYPNVLGRQPDVDGRSFWIGFLDQGNSRAEMILLVSNSPEFIDANPLPSDDREVPAPIDTTRFFDGIAGYNGVAYPVANDVSRATLASLHAAYLQTAFAENGRPVATSRTAVAGGFRYTYDGGESVTYTNPLLDASGRITHFDINGVPLIDRSAWNAVDVPDLAVEVFVYQYITTGGATAIRVVVDSSSTLDRETFAFDWDFTSSTGPTTKPFDWHEQSLIPAGGRLDVIAVFDGDGQTGGTLDLEIFFDENGTTFAQPISLEFSN